MYTIAIYIPKFLSASNVAIVATGGMKFWLSTTFHARRKTYTLVWKIFQRNVSPPVTTLVAPVKREILRPGL